jgi:hypothetical protein
MAAIAPPLAIILALAVVSILQSGACTDTSKAGLFPMALFLNAPRLFHWINGERWSGSMKIMACFPLSSREA